MKYKPDWPEAQERLAALWEGRCIERLCIAVTEPNGRKLKYPKPISDEQKWLDPRINESA